MKNNKVDIELDIEELLGLKEPKKHTLEYDLDFLINNGMEAYQKMIQEEKDKKEEFLRLFKECFDDICIYMEKDPLRRVSVNCFTCVRGMDLRDKYGKPKTK